MTTKNLFRFILLFSCASFQLVFAYADTTRPYKKITQQEKLRGSITPERAWWDLTHYHLDIAIDVESQSITGTNTMEYKVLSDAKELQIELQAPMVLQRVEQNGETLSVRQDGYSYFISLKQVQQIGDEYKVTMHFGGQPKVAIRPPWDGGITWKKDNNELPFIASSNQTIGSSIWWPSKDHGYDEPNKGLLMSVEVPEHLMDVSNGRLINIEENLERGTKTYHWKVVNPINNYGVNINIGDYVHFSEKYEGENGTLDMDYYVLRDNLEKAKTHFKDAKKTIEAFEHWFGPYPFYEDGYKLVEVPYLGMEHQSSVTYGNEYKKGYLGRDLSKTGWGLKFDFIIIHETGHEWFANSITAEDVADMWIHESFTNYSEGLFLEYHYSKDAGDEYIRGVRTNISNDVPIIGTYNAHRHGSKDMYSKGANLIHTIRQLVDNDEKWRNILRGINNTFFHQVVTTQTIENYIAEQSGIELDAVFDQYLRDSRLPVLEYLKNDEGLSVRWSNCINAFDMKIKVNINGKEQWISPTTTWQQVANEKPISTFNVDSNFYISTLNVLGN